jgi:hypothetical protein
MSALVLAAPKLVGFRATVNETSTKPDCGGDESKVCGCRVRHGDDHRQQKRHGERSAASYGNAGAVQVQFSDSILQSINGLGNGIVASAPAGQALVSVSVRPEGARHQRRRVPPRELSIDLVAIERLGRATGRAEAS